MFHVGTLDGDLEIDIGFGTTAKIADIDAYHQPHGETGTLDDLDDTWALTFCAKHGIEYDETVLQLELDGPTLHTRTAGANSRREGEFLADYRVSISRQASPRQYGGRLQHLPCVFGRQTPPTQ